MAEGVLRPSTEKDNDVRVKQKQAPARLFETATLHRGIWKNAIHRAIDEKLYSVISFPPDYFGELQVHRFSAGGLHGPHYDSDRQPSPYRERVMTVLYCLDSVDEVQGGGVTFPKGGPLHVRPQAGMAIVYHNTLEDGSLDPKSLHAQDVLTNGSKWTATQYIYASPQPLAARAIIPVFSELYGGQLPQWLSADGWEDAEMYFWYLWTVAASAVFLFFLVLTCTFYLASKRAPAPVDKDKRQ